MREIKFRVWHKKRKEILKSILNPYNFRDQAPSFVLMQFTGLKDKNGKEIYDGDILEYYIGGEEIFTETYQLSYSEERACWQINIIKECNHTNSPQFYSQHLTQTYASCMKIIGNIYKNPELLK